MDVFTKMQTTNDYMLDSIRINGRYLSLRTGQVINTDDRIDIHAALAVIVPHLGSDFVIENTDLINYFGNQDLSNNFIFCLLRQFGPNGERYFKLILAVDACCVDTVKVVYDITAIRGKLLTLNTAMLLPGTVIPGTSAEITWNAVENAQNFTLEVAPDGFELVWSVAYSGGETHFTVENLDATTLYWFRVTTQATGLNSSVSEPMAILL